ncbi:MAG: serine hydrolase domain-containing protein [Gammaproteobacteria bacterium]
MVLRRVILAWLLGVAGLAHAAPKLIASDVEAWADATFTRAFDDRRFSGLVIAVVQDDALLFARGYGYADFERKSPIDPARTRFRIGSITKTFTAMAIAQLLERGRIRSIDDPVNMYLRRDRLPRVNGKDITLRHLLTHTAGFDSRLFHLATDESFSLPLSAAQVASQQPRVVREPGARSVYSNYGTALLAIVVEDITGRTIESYFREYLFKPMRMEDSVLNVTPRPSPNLGVPYRFLPSGAAQAQPFYGVHPFFAPVGAIESTATDMARYMIANLREGGDDSSAVLGPARFRELHRRIGGNNPASSGFGMIFITLDWNGATFYGHGGDWPGFHSIVLMSPESRTGVFISCMCEAPQPALLESVLGSERMKADPKHTVLEPMTNIGVANAFLGRFWGKRDPVTLGVPDAARATGADSMPRAGAATSAASTSSAAERFVGTYWHEYRNYDTVEKFLDLLGGESSTLLVERGGDGGLRINGRDGYREVSPGVFWNAAAEPGLGDNFWNSGLWAFTSDSAGAVSHASPTFGIDPYLRAGGFANPRSAMNTLLACALIGLTGLMAAFWPGGSGLARLGKWLPLLSVVALIAMVPVLLMGYPEGDGPVTALLLGHGARFIGLSVLANLIAVIALCMAILTVLAWRRRYWGVGWRAGGRRVHFTLLAVATIGLAWVFGFANLLGARWP